ncbi:uncharacterized protein LOC107273707 [Cephus cinctus]|uniref:Uncharacterized protein LOC107273707 n=1 Tax=Cephus cinctus TaxID=211228 RepID=A0AAJ7RUB3_CEPCN|nr:uncharacterized protein LOC107273707 [Cephus cinctus]
MAVILRRLIAIPIKFHYSLMDVRVHDSHRYPSHLRVLGRNLSLKCPNPPSFTTSLAMPKDYENVMNLMCESYFKYEPSIVNIGLSGRAPASLMHFVQEHLREGMTLVARGQDNCIVGAAINVGSCPWDPERAISFANCCECGPAKDLIKFYAYVTMQPRLWERFCVLKIFECCYVTVHPDYQGQGLGKRLIQESWYLARDCGYSLFRIDCTSRYTAKIAENFGWECVYKLPYRRYIEADELVFNFLSPSSS